LPLQALNPASCPDALPLGRGGRPAFKYANLARSSVIIGFSASTGVLQLQHGRPLRRRLECSAQTIFAERRQLFPANLPILSPGLV